MGLTISTFTPDSIVLGTDSLAEVKNNDDGFYQADNEKIFIISGRYAVAIENCAFYNGLPISAYITDGNICNWHGRNVEDLAQYLCSQFSQLFPEEDIMAYVAGYDSEDCKYLPRVFLIHDQRIDCINRQEEGKHVYNFHAIGRTHWINKLLMNTETSINGEVLQFKDYDIDFSKYSTQFARKFVKHMLRLSEEMDRFSQLKPSIGGQYEIVTIRPNQNITLEIL